MADWVDCTDARGERVLLNLDAAYAIRPAEKGSAVTFLIGMTTHDGIRPITYNVSQTPDQLMLSMRARPDA